MKRRNLFKNTAAALGAGVAGSRAWTGLAEESESMINEVLKTGPVKFTRDNLDLEPAEYASLLATLAKAPGIASDSYSLGGVVQELEQKIATRLGKEAAIFMPTGTLANQLAVTAQSGPKSRRVLALAKSHLFNDAGDGTQALGALSVIPIGGEEATFSLEAVKAEVARCAQSKVALRIGTIAIESPVRRCDNQRFGFDELKSIATFAREEKIAVHLDGARLFIESAYSGIDVAEYARHCDSVYVSLYKCFHSASGAVLAGPSSMIEGLYHQRRMYGGGVPQAWPYAAVALAFVDGMTERLGSAVQVFEDFKKALKPKTDFLFEPISNGTNVSLLTLRRGNAHSFRSKLRERDIHLPAPDANTGVFKLKTNETLNRSNAKDLAEAFESCL
ncbi:MAG: beta-eliminating lyase-related protein [Planctomycetota bacterium]